MPLPQLNPCTSEDYWNLPDGERAELIGGKLYAMAPPSRIHQELIAELLVSIRQHIKDHDGLCKVYPAPFAVNLDADNEDWVEPDISVICDPGKLTDRGCSGAPDLVIEVVSPGSRKMDYNIKNALYSQSGVREYWIVDPEKKRSTVYYFEKDAAPMIYTFDQPVNVEIMDGLSITISTLI